MGAALWVLMVWGWWAFLWVSWIIRRIICRSGLLLFAFGSIKVYDRLLLLPFMWAFLLRLILGSLLLICFVLHLLICFVLHLLICFVLHLLICFVLQSLNYFVFQSIIIFIFCLLVPFSIQKLMMIIQRTTT